MWGRLSSLPIRAIPVPLRGWGIIGQPYPRRCRGLPYYALSGLLQFPALDPRRCRGLSYFAPSGLQAAVGATVNRPWVGHASFSSKLCFTCLPCRHSKHAKYMSHPGIPTTLSVFIPAEGRRVPARPTLSVFICVYLRSSVVPLHPHAGRRVRAVAHLPARNCLD